MTTQEVNWGGWSCLRLSDDALVLVVTTQVGPRIVSFGRPGGSNQFREFPDQHGHTGPEWQVMGGHRLWHAPEQKPRSYQPDNDPVDVRVEDQEVRFIQPTEERTGIRKEIAVRLASGVAIIRHTLRNEGCWPVRLAPWALTVVAPGGIAVIPQPERQSSESLLPDRSVVLWPYTNPGDPRLVWGNQFLAVRMDPGMTSPTKIGTQASEGWCAYVRSGTAFVKGVPRAAGTYPDFNSSIEVYTAGDFLELETLGPLVELAPGDETAHTEVWGLVEGVSVESEDHIHRTLAGSLDPILTAVTGT